MDLKSVREDALSLPPSERAELAETLLESLESLPEDEIERLWLDEAERRMRQVEDGSISLIPGDEVSRRARALLK